jgi:hypothetical protein
MVAASLFGPGIVLLLFFRKTVNPVQDVLLPEADVSIDDDLWQWVLLVATAKPLPG